MYRPKFQILIESEKFYPDEFMCSGSQLIKIVECLKNVLTPHFWYGANIFSFDEFDKRQEPNSFDLLLIGDDEALRKICSEVGQFLSGVLFAVDNNFISQNIENILVDTEDEQYRPVDIEGVLIEIRLFDTSFFCVFSEDEKIINELAERFEVAVSVSEKNSA